MQLVNMPKTVLAHYLEMHFGTFELGLVFKFAIETMVHVLSDYHRPYNFLNEPSP